MPLCFAALRRFLTVGSSELAGGVTIPEWLGQFWKTPDRMRSYARECDCKLSRGLRISTFPVFHVTRKVRKKLDTTLDTTTRAECRFDFTSRLVLMEEAKSLPWPIVWQYYCVSKNMPSGGEWLGTVRKYEAEILSK
jgi:hypothetical protein